ncbi:hypothetical protein EV378_1246 [Pseudonocardia endophytica]|uniref:DUF222 domain-containing protein n=1 Tax=Pseudonocardia endophytica TaxID=401976 RepID=A0A4R1HTA2_PSEEN|nr:hypothetical protein EV378_1246 [Pseudonocardia endophytica]
MAAVPDGDVPALPTVEALPDRLGAAHPAIALPAQLALATERAAWLGARLAEQIAAEGVAGVVGESRALSADGEPVTLGEFARVLWEAEARERANVATLAERVARLGLDSRDAQQDSARWTASALRTFVAELGLSDRDEPTWRAAKRAAIVARRAMGHEDADPDVHAGPRLSLRERATLLREAAERAERAADELDGLPQRPA